MIIRPENPNGLIKMLTAAPLILYGIGDTGRHIAGWCRNHKIDYVISDKRIEELRDTLEGEELILPQSIPYKYADANVVISSIAYVREITNDLLGLGIKEERIFPPFIFMPDRITLPELEENGLVDWERMRQRCEMVSAWGWIPTAVRSVVDYSAGEGFLIKKHLPSRVAYHPVDYLDRGNDTIVCDFSKGEFPDIYAELSVCLAMAMYTEAAEKLIDNICQHSEKLSIFTAITWEGLPDVRLRRYSAMVSDLTEQEISDRFAANGFCLRDKRYHAAGNSMMTFFLFERIGEVK